MKYAIPYALYASGKILNLPIFGQKKGLPTKTSWVTLRYDVRNNAPLQPEQKILIGREWPEILGYQLLDHIGA